MNITKKQLKNLKDKWESDLKNYGLLMDVLKLKIGYLYINFSVFQKPKENLFLNISFGSWDINKEFDNISLCLDYINKLDLKDIVNLTYQ
jgi:hypothetical protein